jgi:hypothetical protein
VSLDTLAVQNQCLTSIAVEQLPTVTQNFPGADLYVPDHDFQHHQEHYCQIYASPVYGYSPSLFAWLPAAASLLHGDSSMPALCEALDRR